MRIFFDSSAFAKRFIQETGSEKIDSLCLEADSICLSSISVPEILSAANRKLREKNISRREYSKIKNRLLEDVNDMEIINITNNVLASSVQLLEKNILRTLDALHIACALESETKLFVSSDKRQIQAAKKAGLNVKYVG